ncbi:putative deacetylvindoline O-acetyltransferase [Helianthus anomalus]
MEGFHRCRLCNLWLSKNIGLGPTASAKTKKIKIALLNPKSPLGKQMVLNSFSYAANNPDTTNVTWLASWCKFPFYAVNFGFGKPLWIGCGFVPFKRGMMLLDDAKGNAVEAYATMGVKDVSYFEQDEDIKAFAA